MSVVRKVPLEEAYFFKAGKATCMPVSASGYRNVAREGRSLLSGSTNSPQEKFGYPAFGVLRADYGEE